MAVEEGMKRGVRPALIGRVVERAEEAVLHSSQLLPLLPLRGLQLLQLLPLLLLRGLQLLQRGLNLGKDVTRAPERSHQPRAVPSDACQRIAECVDAGQRGGDTGRYGGGGAPPGPAIDIRSGDWG